MPKKTKQPEVVSESSSYRKMRTPRPGQSGEERAAEVLLSPETRAALNLHAMLGEDEDGKKPLKLDPIWNELTRMSEAINAGDMAYPERVAISQIATLNTLFHQLSEMAIKNQKNQHFDRLMRLAFKAQSQCSRTLETIAGLKHPAIIAKQLNMANQQVVNNAPMPAKPEEPPLRTDHPSKPIADTGPANSSFGAFQKTPARKSAAKKES